MTFSLPRCDRGSRRDLPLRFAPQLVYDRFHNRTREGLWDRTLRRLRDRKMYSRGIVERPFRIDGSVVLAHRSGAGTLRKRGLQTLPEAEAHPESRCLNRAEYAIPPVQLRVDAPEVEQQLA